MDIWREIHLFNKKSVEIYNPHASNWKTYHADVKMLRGMSFLNSMMRCMAFRQDYSTYFVATVTFPNCGHHAFLVFFIARFHQMPLMRWSGVICANSGSRPSDQAMTSSTVSAGRR